MGKRKKNQERVGRGIKDFKGRIKGNQQKV
jgi:hypothetical protein